MIDHFNNSRPERLVPTLRKPKARVHLKRGKKDGRGLVKVANPQSEEETVVEADWVDEQQGVEGRLLVQLAIPGVDFD